MRRRRTQRLLIASMLVLLIAVAGLAIGFFTGRFRLGADTTVANRENEPSKAPEHPVEHFDRPKPAGDRTDRTGVRPDDSQSTASDTAASAPEPPADPEQMARFQSELQAARKALGDRQYPQAEERIDAARQLAVSKKQNQIVLGYQALTSYTEGFWDGVQEGLKELEKAGELQVGDTVVSVVEVGPAHLLIREAGKNRRYSVDQLPSRLAVAIAEHWFDERPVNKLSLGAHYFVTPPINVAEARRLWEEAANAGVDVKGLLALLPMDD